MNAHARKAGLVAAAALLSLTAACGGTSAKASAAGDSSACPNGQVRFGVEPYEAPAKLTPAYEVLTKALEKGLGCPVKLQIVQDYAAEVLAMKNGQLDLAEFGPLGYVFAQQEAKAEAVASFADANGKLSSYTAGLWVPANSPITSLAGLKGKTVALSSAGSTSGDALPRYALQKAGISQGDLTLQYAGGHPQSLLALVKGKVDAGEINSQELPAAVAANEIDPSKFRKIWASDPIPNDPITVYGGLSQQFKDKVKAVLTSLQPADVAAIGKFLDVDPAGPMIAVDKSTYQPLFDLASALHLTKKDV